MVLDGDLRILIVDDSAAMRKILRNMLKNLGLEHVLEAEDGKQALAALASGRVDLIISDWNMPRMKGIDLLRSVRAAEPYKNIPFLMVTAEGLKTNIVEAVKAGVSGYLTKPFTAERLEEKLARIFVKLES